MCPSTVLHRKKQKINAAPLHHGTPRRPLGKGRLLLLLMLSHALQFFLAPASLAKFPDIKTQSFILSPIMFFFRMDSKTVVWNAKKRNKQLTCFFHHFHFLRSHRQSRVVLVTVFLPFSPLFWCTKKERKEHNKILKNNETSTRLTRNTREVKKKFFMVVN